MSKEKALQPALRFNSFEGDWEEKTIKSSCSEFRSGRFLRAHDIKEIGLYPVYGGNGLRGYYDHFSHDGTYALIGRQGALCGNMNLSFGKAYFTEHAIAVQANQSSDTLFLYHKLKLMDLGQYSGQSAQPGLAVNKLLGLSTFSPKKEEQTQIGTFFQHIDQQLKLHQSKHTKLQQLKKSMLGKMFPKAGTKVPEVRFAGCDGDWKSTSLADVVDVRSGRDYKHLNKGSIPVYGTGGYMLSVNKALSYNEDAIGIGRKGTIDRPFVLRAPFWTVDTLFYSVPKLNNDLQFTYALFQKVNWKDKDESTGVPSLSKVAINGIPVISCSLREQTKIGKYFQNLDRLIELQQQHIDKLKNIKQACLEKMFV